MQKTVLALICLAMAAAGAAEAQAQVKRSGGPTSVISSMVSVPAGYETLYLAGTTAGGGGGPIPATMDTKAQTAAILTKLKDQLAAEKLGLGDIVAMRVELVGVATNGGRMDTAGMNEAFRTFFGTPEQPNKPSRTTVQVAALGSPTTLVEITAVAVRKP